MLDSLRRWASGWVAFVMIMLLIMSFAIWGVADYITGASRAALATVGGEEISADEFQTAFQDEISELSQRAGQRISFEQARAVGLDQRVLNQLIGSAAVEAHARDLGLVLSAETLADGLKRDPAFQGPDGRFSKEQLEGVMRQLGLSEAGLLALRRRDELRKHVTSAFLRSAIVPEPLIDTLNAYRNETRILTHARIDADKAITLPEPSDEDLRKTYEANKSSLMSEPHRHLYVLMMPIAALRARADIADADIKAAYEQTRGDYDVPEKRKVQQISFKDKSAAEAAKRELDGGKDYVEVAKAAGATAADIDLGLVTRTQLIDPAIADAAFRLEKDKVSEPVEGRFATVLLRVSEIVPGKDSTFEETRDKVRAKLADEWARAQAQKLYSEVDDGRAAGTPLKDIGSTLKLPYYDVPSVTRANKTDSGQIVLDVPDADEIIAAGFRGEVGLEGEAVALTDGGYAWVDVVAATPAAERPFEEVKQETKEIWTRTERRRRLSELASKLAERLRAGEDFAKVAEEVGGKAQTTLPVTRTAIPEGLTQSALSQAFVLPKGGVGHAETADGTSRVLLRVDDVRAPSDLTKEQRDALRQELRQDMRADQISAYIAALQDRLGVSVNQQAFDRLMGAPGQ
ncbi:MAG: SurA N-terminal domain-containing protein [Hyphomicrobiaceae bacterium]|nr:SurA N-terminal domain-containing protein [Hyphomicrobiaceae bacterium]